MNPEIHPSSRSRLLSGAALTCLALTLASPSVAVGQDKVVQPSEAQLELNTKAVEAVGRGDREVAVKLFRSSLELGELNITWLNLGRTLLSMGRCEEALSALDKVATAPRVASPSPSEVAEVVARSRERAPTLCPGQLTITCADPETRVRVGEEERGACGGLGGPIDLKAGEYVVEGRLGEERESHRVTIQGLRGETVTFQLKPAVTEPPPPVEPPQEGLGALQLTGLIVAGVGAGALAGGLILDLAVIGPDLDELDAMQREPGREDDYNALKSDVEGRQGTAAVLLIGGGALVAAGAVLWLVGDNSAEGASEGAAADALHLWTPPGGGAGASWSASW